MRITKKQDWMIACDGKKEGFPFGFACLRCGQKYALQLPIGLREYAELGKFFMKAHQHCKPTEVPE